MGHPPALAIQTSVSACPRQSAQGASMRRVCGGAGFIFLPPYYGSDLNTASARATPTEDPLPPCWTDLTSDPNVLGATG